MKEVIIVTGCCLASIISFGQCDKKFVIISSKTEYLNTDSVVQRTIDENTIIELNNEQLTISPGNKKMTAAITADSCNWAVPYMQGQSVMSATFTDDQGVAKAATITITGKDAKLTFLVQIDGMPYMIRVPIDSFGGKK